MSKLVVSTPVGAIRLQFNSRTPETVSHVKSLVAAGKLGNAKFYRSDFVIQFGVHGNTNADRPSLKVNESRQSGMSNVRGTAAFAHWDVPDCGNTEMFINLKDNPHLDSAYGGFCAFAAVDSADGASFAVMDTVAAKILSDGTVPILSISVE